MDDKTRREFLRNGWKLGGALLDRRRGLHRLRGAAAAGVAARAAPRSPSARPRATPTDTSTYVSAGRLFVVNANDYVFALSQKCPHLGCQVPFCESSGRFECPCHGSIYDLGGEWIAGPAPRGMDRYEVTLDGDNVVVDTGVAEDRARRAAPRTSSRPPKGPSCIGKA